MQVTEYNVGRWCLSEDECNAGGINFAAYERGVSDAAKAFGQNRAASPPLPQEQGAVPQKPLPEMEVFVLFNRHRPLDDGSEALAFARAIEAAHCIFPAPPVADPRQAQMGETK